LAALYVLNLYYRNESIKDISLDDITSVNPSFGSSLFAVKIHKLIDPKVDGPYQKRCDYDQCVYIEDYEQRSKKNTMKSTSAMRKKCNDLLSDVDPKLPELILECFRVLLRYDIVLNKQQY
jgi:hypothetical protein